MPSKALHCIPKEVQRYSSCSPIPQSIYGIIRGGNAGNDKWTIIQIDLYSGLLNREPRAVDNKHSVVGYYFGYMQQRYDSN